MGPAIIPHIILGIVNVLLSTTLLVLIGNKFFPFSRSESNNSNTGSFLRNMFMLLVAGAIALIHFLVFNVIAVVIIFILLSAVALWVLMGNIRNTSWASIKSRYADD